MADAVRAITLTDISGGRGKAYKVSWTSLDSDDSGLPLFMPWLRVHSVQITGTFGSGGSVTLQGSNDGTNYVALTDPQGNAITKTAAGLEQVEERTAYVRPLVTAGDGTTSLAVTLLLTVD